MRVLAPLHMRVRADFLRAQKGIRRSAKGLLLEVCRSPLSVPPGHYRLGFTASRKVGGAVQRNRAKRRLRAAAAAVLPGLGGEGVDYVLIARVQTLSRPFESLKADLVGAIEGAHLLLGRSD